MQFSMAVPHQSSSVYVCTSTTFGRIGLGVPISRSSTSSRGGLAICPVQCVVNIKSSQDTIHARRSANVYGPSIWSSDYIHSITSEYTEEQHGRRRNELKEEVKVMLSEKVEGSLAQLELIDALQRLGVSYHFESEIDSILKEKYAKTNYTCKHTCTNNSTLYASALEFRVLRQHGYLVPQEIFNVFKYETGKFKACMSSDIMGILSLYEASFYLVKGESVLEEARQFTTKCLERYMMTRQNKLNHDDDHDHLGLLVSHALELPLHWRMLRSEARWFIDAYEKRQDKNSALLEFAKLDFNMVQLIHQQDLKHVSRWWRHTKLGQKLNFARDRIMENFFWTIGLKFEQQFTYFRRMSAKINALITTIDDIYDVYGTLDELKLFTDAVERWDMNAINQLPDYMKIPFLALHNSINEMVFDVLTEQEFLSIEYFKKTWVDICKCYLLEAKWYHSGYTPTLQEYIDNAWISISGPVILTHSYFLLKDPITKEALECLEEYYPSIIRQSSMILRLVNDLGTSSDELKRGDIPKSVQCYMYETGVFEDEARQHIKFLLSETWQQMNEDLVSNSCFCNKFLEVATNLARMALFMYQHGDGHASQDHRSQERISTLLINPIPVPNN